jgi:hypothetical protein
MMDVKATGETSSPQKENIQHLKGLSYEIDFENVDEN